MDRPSTAEAAPEAGAGRSAHRRGRRGRRNWPSHRQAPVVRGLALGLWALVALAAAGGVAGFVALGRGGPEAVTGAGRNSPGSSAAAESFAELFVMSWVSAGEAEEAELERFVDEGVSLTGRMPDALRASWVGTVSSELVDTGYWSVTVAAVVEEAAPGGYRPLGVHHYRVPVLVEDDGLVVTALPSQVPAPARVDRPPLELTTKNALPPGEVTDTIEAFFGAYLAGQGDVERYVRPASAVRAVEPAPFVSIEVVGGQIRENGDSAQAAVQVAGTDAGERTTSTAYTLRLLRRDGRWEVVELLPAPPLQVVNGKGEPR